MKQNLVTRLQALWLRELGFNEHCTSYMSRLSKEDDFGFLVENASPFNHNKVWYSLSVPTVDETIDWLRRKHKIVIYNAIEPFVDPGKKDINYAFKVKVCNVIWGWNMRKYLGRTKTSTDIYVRKREAITIALKYLRGSVCRKSTES